MSGIRIGRILIVLAVICVGVWTRMGRRADASNDVKADVMTMLADVEDYSANQKFYDLRADMAHSQAMDAAYTMGGRFRKDKFDDDKYLAVFFDRLTKYARDDGRQDIVKSLLKFREERGIPNP